VTEMIIKTTSRMGAYLRLMRFHRPIGIYLLLWPTLWALWIGANGIPLPHILFVFVSGVVVMRAAGCVINDFADRKFDGHVERTKTRPLASGEVSVTEGLVLFSILSLIAFSLVLTLNRFTIILSFGGILLAVVYPFMKRFISWPQFILGLAFSWSIPMAFAAQLNHVPPIAWLLFVITALWTVSYDTLYAMADAKEDMMIGVKSTALLFGKYSRQIVAIMQASVLVLLVLLGFIEKLGIIYFGFIAAGALLFLYQQKLIRNNDPEACFRAFLNNGWFGFLIFLGIAFCRVL